MGVLDTLLWMADENANEVREKERSRRQHVTAGQLEEQEWAALTAKVQRRQRLLGDMVEDEEDEGEALELLVSVLAESKGPLTLFEVMRQLQRLGLLSLEFPAAARKQTSALLYRLRVANRVWQDPHGRWSLL
jgi:predicted DNA-binding ribbon-helix-helix protein